MNRYTSVLIAVLIIVWSACGTPSKYPITDQGTGKTDDRILGKWKYVEDTNKLNFYAISQFEDQKGTNEYHVRFWNRGGTNPTYEANIHFSDVAGTTFINVPYWEKVSNNGGTKDWVDKGWFFLKVIESDKAFTKLTTATVISSKIANLKNQAEVKGYLSRHVNNPAIYSDTAHFYKLSE